MYKFFIIIFISTFLSTLSNAEIFNKININGNKRVSEETIKVYGNIKTLGSNLSKLDGLLSLILAKAKIG